MNIENNKQSVMDPHGRFEAVEKGNAFFDKELAVCSRKVPPAAAFTLAD